MAFATEAITAATTLNYFICVAFFTVSTNSCFVLLVSFLFHNSFAHKKGWTKESQPTTNCLFFFMESFSSFLCFFVLLFFFFFLRYPKALKTFKRFLFEIYYRKHNFLSARLIFSTIKLVKASMAKRTESVVCVNGMKEFQTYSSRSVSRGFLFFSWFSRVFPRFFRCFLVKFYFYSSILMGEKSEETELFFFVFERKGKKNVSHKIANFHKFVQVVKQNEEEKISSFILLSRTYRLQIYNLVFYFFPFIFIEVQL